MDEGRKQAALDKLRKLIRVHQDPRGNPNETALALQKAVAISAQYELDLDAILQDLSQSEDEFVTEEVVIGPYLDPATQCACEILGDFFHVNTYYEERPQNKHVIGIYGLQHHVVFALHVLDFLRERSNTAWQEAKKSFMVGYFSSISSNLSRLVESDDPDFFDPARHADEDADEDEIEESRLTIHKVDNARQRSFEQKFRVTGEVRPVYADMSSSAARLGGSAGEQVQIHRALSS